MYDYLNCRNYYEVDDIDIKGQAEMGKTQEDLKYVKEHPQLLVHLHWPKLLQISCYYYNVSLRWIPLYINMQTMRPKLLNCKVYNSIII